MSPGDIPELVIGLVFLLTPIWFLSRPWLTRNWPTAKARLVKVYPPNRESLLARFERFEFGQDYAVEYVVDGTEYKRTYGITFWHRLGRMRMQVIPVVPDEFDIRYHPSRPKRTSIVHVYPGWYRAAATAFFIAFGLYVLIFWI